MEAGQIEQISAVAAGVTLVALWSFEALLPAFVNKKIGIRRRVRHLAIGGLNALVAAALVIVLRIAGESEATAGFGLLRRVEWPWLAELAIAFLAFDFFQYAFHQMAHRIPALWRLHAVHHSADRMDATLALRFHMIEIAVQCAMVTGFAILLGAGVLELAVYNLVLTPVALFHHSNMRMPGWLDRPLQMLIVTPRMHWIHHSRWQPETDSNYGAVLSMWDRLFGSFRSRRRPETVSIGLDGFPTNAVDSLPGMMKAPFGPLRTTNGDRPADELLEPDGFAALGDATPRARTPVNDDDSACVRPATACAERGA